MTAVIKPNAKIKCERFRQKSKMVDRRKEIVDYIPKTGEIDALFISYIGMDQDCVWVLCRLMNEELVVVPHHAVRLLYEQETVHHDHLIIKPSQGLSVDFERQVEDMYEGS